MPSQAFAPGFRFSMLDAVVLLIGTVAAVASAMVVWSWGFVIAFVVAHFFLFCNIVRMSRPLELTWAAAFLALAVPTVLTENPGWLLTAALSLIVTAVVVSIEMRRPSYHGMGWQRINPDLPAWWEAQAAERLNPVKGKAPAD